MHGNASCRLEAIKALPYLMHKGITVCCFDFAGCGNSDGEYISLGWHERDDIGMIVSYLRKERNVSSLGLWGRSMGAATAILHSDRDASIEAIVLDSPFADLPRLCNELAYKNARVPGMLVHPVLKLVHDTIEEKADFDIYKVKPIDHVPNIQATILFATATEDTFIGP